MSLSPSIQLLHHICNEIWSLNEYMRAKHAFNLHKVPFSRVKPLMSVKVRKNTKEWRLIKSREKVFLIDGSCQFHVMTT